MGSAKIDKQISQNWVEKEQTKGKEKIASRSSYKDIVKKSKRKQGK